MKRTTRLFVFCFGLVAVCLGQKSGATAKVASTVFTNVSLLRRAAAPVLPAVGWNSLAPGTFIGTSDHYVELQPATGFVPSTVVYCISGIAAGRVDEAVVS